MTDAFHYSDNYLQQQLQNDYCLCFSRSIKNSINFDACVTIVAEVRGHMRNPLHLGVQALFTPRYFRSLSESWHWELSLPGTFVPGNFRSAER